MAEKRLIDANEIEELFYKQIEYGATDPKNAFDDALQDAPTVDAVEVVRCKDCIHWDSETGWCNNHSAFDDNDMDWNIYNDDDFCSTGERRTDG